MPYVKTDPEDALELSPVDAVQTPVNLRPNLSDFGIEEFDKGICEDSYENRTILRKNRLAWRPIYDASGNSTGQIEVLSPGMLAGQAAATLEDRKIILEDERNKNSDYLQGLDLLYETRATSIVPPWVMNATRSYYDLEQKRKEEPDKKISPSLVSFPGRCRYIKADGIRCLLWHAGRVRDDGLCRTHLGAVKNQTGGAVERARERIQQAAPAAVDVLEELMETATSEPVRLGAAKEILDRAGVRGGTEIDAKITLEMKPASETIRERLEELKAGAIKKAAVMHAIEHGSDPEDTEEDGIEEIEDAVVIEDD